MFHTYIFASSGREIDFDRASFLMDKELLADAMNAMQEEKKIRPNRPPIPLDSPFANWNGPRDENEWAQWVWRYYCKRHHEKYGESFVPDVNPAWDS